MTLNSPKAFENTDFLQSKNIPVESNNFSTYERNRKTFVFSEKFVNLLLRDGKKLKAWKIYFTMLELLKSKVVEQDLSVFEIVERALNNCTPSLEVRKVRVAGTTYLVPTMISKKKQQAIAMRWIIEAAKKKKKTTKLSFAQCVADEIFDAFLKQGYARTKTNELHHLAEANRASRRYRWW